MFRVRENRNIVEILERKGKADWIVHFLLKTCLPKHIIEGNIDGISNGKARKKT